MTTATPHPSNEVTADWVDLSPVPGAAESFAHHGLAFTAAGELLAFHAGQLVAIDPHGTVTRCSDPGLTEGHGLTLVHEGEEERVWIADPGFAIACGSGTGDGLLPPTFGLGLDFVRTPGRVVQTTVAGDVVRELATPPADHDDKPGPFAPYAPTSVAVDEVRLGGSGDIWVADGYGSNVVHRYDADGRHLATLTGAAGGGRFDCPHFVFIDRRPGKSPELYVTDRGNARLAVYDLDGEFLRLAGESVLDSPSGLVAWEGNLVVVELSGRLTLLDLDDQLVGHLGDDLQAAARPGWPNAWDEDRRARRPDDLRPGLLNSPHAAAVDTQGRLVVAEWVIGGRYTSWRPTSPTT
nr:hypothetical protein [uncultured Nocardioides sp.]